MDMGSSDDDKMQLLTPPGLVGFKCKVSSVLNRASDFQAKHMFNDDDYCWNSEGSEPGEGGEAREQKGQWLQVEFLDLGECAAVVDVAEIRIMFQGGFVGTEGVVHCGTQKDALRQVCVLDHVKSIDDSNDWQVWKLPPAAAENIKFLRISFPASTDFFGRVTIYRLNVFGNRR